MRELLFEKIKQEGYKLTIVDPVATSIKNKKFDKSKKVVSVCMKIEDWTENNLDDYVSSLSKK
jgi:predicted transcriptional regulator